MPTMTVYPSASYEDGQVKHAGVAGDTWANMRGAAGNQADDSDTNDYVVEIKADADPGEWDVITRGIFGFDTDIGPGYQVDVAVFSLYGVASSDLASQHSPPHRVVRGAFHLEDSLHQNPSHSGGF